MKVLFFQKNLTYDPETKSDEAGRYCDVTCQTYRFMFRFSIALDFWLCLARSSTDKQIRV